MPGADLRLAKKQRGVVPAAVEHIHDSIGNAGHLGLVFPEAADHLADIGHELAAVEFEMVGGQSNIGAILLQNIKQPVGELDVSVAGAFGVPKRLNEGLVANPVQLAGYGLQADVGHGSTSS